jgi:hypothetical protein
LLRFTASFVLPLLGLLSQQVGLKRTWPAAVPHAGHGPLGRNQSYVKQRSVAVQRKSEGFVSAPPHVNPVTSTDPYLTHWDSQSTVLGRPQSVGQLRPDGCVLHGQNVASHVMSAGFVEGPPHLSPDASVITQGKFPVTHSDTKRVEAARGQPVGQLRSAGFVVQEQSGFAGQVMSAGFGEPAGHS